MSLYIHNGLLRTRLQNDDRRILISRAGMPDRRLGIGCLRLSLRRFATLLILLDFQ